jgi:cell division protein FtsW
MSKASVIMLFSALLLFSLGLVMVFNTTSAEVLDGTFRANTHYALIKQIIFGLMGIGAGFLIWFVGYRNILRLSPALFWFSIILLILVLIPGIGQEINGAKRWIYLFGYSFQPSELIKYIIPLYFINILLEEKQILSFFKFIKIMLLFSLPIGLVLFEPDNGTVAIIIITLIILFILTGIKYKYWVFPLLLMIGIGGSLAYQMPHVPARIRIYLHPELDLKGKGHQPHQAKIAAGSGRLYGRGLGESLQKLNYLPEARSDYIAAIYAEEFGFLGMLFLITLYMSIGCSIFFIAVNARDKGGFYLASIICFLITFQAFVNLGVVSGLLPSKGIALPFFSQGGTSVFIHIIALSVILNIDYFSKRRKERRA